MAQKTKEMALISLLAAVITVAGLLRLPGVIPGMIDCVIRTELGPKSNADCMMECTFESMEALEAYCGNPLHMEIAVSKVRPYTIDRLGVDYEEQ